MSVYGITLVWTIATGVITTLKAVEGIEAPLAGNDATGTVEPSLTTALNLRVRASELGPNSGSKGTAKSPTVSLPGPEVFNDCETENAQGPDADAQMDVGSHQPVFPSQFKQFGVWDDDPGGG